MENKNEKVFTEMSQSFQRAFGYASNGHYRQSIPLYENAIQEDKNNFPAFNNIAVAKIYIGIEEQNVQLIEEAVSNLQTAIDITRNVYKYPNGYPIAETNLVWAEQELSKFTK